MFRCHTGRPIGSDPRVKVIQQELDRLDEAILLQWARLSPNPPPSPCSASASRGWVRGAGGSGRRKRNRHRK